MDLIAIKNDYIFTKLQFRSRYDIVFNDNQVHNCIMFLT